MEIVDFHLKGGLPTKLQANSVSKGDFCIPNQKTK